VFDKILVPVDFSDASATALGHGCLLAKHFGGRLELLHVVEHLLYSHPPFWTGEIALAEDLHREATERAQRSMRELVERTRTERGVEPEGSVISGAVPAAIVDHARDGGTELIVVSTHGRTGMSRWLMGSVSERLLRAAPCPVLVARGADGSVPEPRRILVATDLSDHSRRALELSARLAAKLGARLEVIYAWAAPFYGEGAAMHADLFQRIRESASAELAAFVSGVDVPSGLAIDQTVVSGPPTASICDRARESAADLLVMGSHGRSGFQRMVLGSIAESTVRYAPCATLVVP
jgi:nucleotide-binding universal stress UspA family protein